MMIFLYSLVENYEQFLYWCHWCHVYLNDIVDFFLLIYIYKNHG